MLNNLQLANPYWLILLVILPILFWWRHRYNSTYNSVLLPQILNSKKPLKARLIPLLLILELMGLMMMILAMSRPQRQFIEQKITSDGIDIVMSIDISGSMLARDFQPDRLESAKTTAIEFIKGRVGDRIGLVIFAGESFTLCPITIDKKVLIRQIGTIKSGLLEDGTAIGMGLATAVNRLKESNAKSKVIILLTDGVNNAGEIDPETAGEVAKAFGIKVYIIGVGTKGQAPMPVNTIFGTQMQMMDVLIDEELMQKISEITGAKYFRATDNSKLKAIYQDIDKLEKVKIDITTIPRSTEFFSWFIYLALLFLLIEFTLKNTYFRGIY